MDVCWDVPLGVPISLSNGESCGHGTPDSCVLFICIKLVLLSKVERVGGMVASVRFFFRLSDHGAGYVFGC